MARLLTLQHIYIYTYTYPSLCTFERSTSLFASGNEDSTGNQEGEEAQARSLSLSLSFSLSLSLSISLASLRRRNSWTFSSSFWARFLEPWCHAISSNLQDVLGLPSFIVSVLLLKMPPTALIPLQRFQKEPLKQAQNTASHSNSTINVSSTCLTTRSQSRRHGQPEAQHWRLVSRQLEEQLEKKAISWQQASTESSFWITALLLASLWSPLVPPHPLEAAPYISSPPPI